MTKQELYERARNNIINARNKEEDRRLASQRRQAEWEREQQAQRERIAQQKELDRQEHRAARKVPAPRVSMPVYRRPVTSETNTQSTQPTFVQPIVARPKPFRIRVEEQPVREPRQRHHREPPSELSEEESRRLEQQWRKKIQRQEEIDRRYQERVKEAKDAVAQALIEAQRRQKQLHVATYPVGQIRALQAKVRKEHKSQLPKELRPQPTPPPQKVPLKAKPQPTLRVKPQPQSSGADSNNQVPEPEYLLSNEEIWAENELMWNAGLVTEFDLSDSEIAPDWEAELQEEQRTLGHTVTNTAGHEDVLYATGSLQTLSQLGSYVSAGASNLALAQDDDSDWDSFSTISTSSCLSFSSVVEVSALFDLSQCNAGGLTMNMLAQHEFYDPAEAQRLETVYQAGYIDEEEYQRRRAELVQTFATPLQTHAFLYSVIAKKVADYMGIDMQTEDRAFVLSVHSAAIQGIFNDHDDEKLLAALKMEQAELYDWLNKAIDDADSAVSSKRQPHELDVFPEEQKIVLRWEQKVAGYDVSDTESELETDTSIGMW